MTIKMAIVGHTSRKTLSDKLSYDLLSCPVFMDDGALGCTRNHLRAWEWLSQQDSDWSLLVEDDAKLEFDFLTEVSEVLFKAPTPVVSLYLGRGRPVHWQSKAARAVATNHPFIVCTSLLSAVAVAIRTDYLTGPTGMIEAAWEEAASPMRTPIDEAITAWCKHEAIPVSYTNPSIVDHDDTLPSVAEHHYDSPSPEPRVAFDFGSRSGLPGRSRWYTTPFASM